MAEAGVRLVGPVGASAILHGGVAGVLLLLSARHPPAMPPIYSVEIIAAAPSPTPAIGVVAPTPADLKTNAPAPRAPDMTVPTPRALSIKTTQRPKASRR